MSKKDNIVKDLGEIWYVFLNAKTAYYYAEYMFNPPTEKEKSYMRHYGVEMIFFRKILWRNSVIELANLFVGSQKKSIFKFLNKVDKSGEYNGHITPEKVQELRNKLDRFKGVIEKVKGMRDKVFAHADYDYAESIKYNIIDTDIEKLIIFTQDFISEIFSELNSGVQHGSKLLKEDFNLLKILGDYEDEKYNRIISQFKERLT